MCVSERMSECECVRVREYLVVCAPDPEHAIFMVFNSIQAPRACNQLEKQGRKEALFQGLVV
jgi:hypothetical protein